MARVPLPPSLADPVRLTLTRVLFAVADDELADRRGRRASAPQGAGPGAARGAGGDADAEARRLARALEEHLAGLGDGALERLHGELARALLLEIDRRIAGAGTPPGERPDVSRIVAGSAPERAGGVALVSLPWMSPAMPSIQLATLASALERDGIGCDVHELYVDYAARIGLNLYNYLGNLLGYVPEWIFSRHYYGPETGDDLAEMLAQRPLDEIPWPELADPMLAALQPVTRAYLDDAVRDLDPARYDIVGCSLTISQLGSSMAFARRVKLANPAVKIVFGGSQCAGAMGRAIMRHCPYVDAVVHVEGELVLAEIVRRLRARRSLAGLAGVSHRAADGGVLSNEGTPLLRPDADKLPVDYDAYFRRLVGHGLLGKVNPWLPFESSRGCWYGQKNQCTFCGLHEIMEFRAWDGDRVLDELERLHAKYGVGRFYSMDLIMPREYLHSMLPEISRRGHDWMFFYEMKANMRFGELRTLADAGVRWVQPGIESLDGDLLRLMRKGVSAAQNILLLKWCRELGIYCGWNLLYGLPGETQAPYDRMAAMIPKLAHLQPPSGGGAFQLHRFSPYFDHPERYGIRWLGAHAMFRYAFPLPKRELDELVYLHDFELDDATGALADTSAVDAALSHWRRAYRAGATLQLRLDAGAGAGATIVDGRDVERAPVVHRLDAAHSALYRMLGDGVFERKLVPTLADQHPEALAQLGEDGVRAALQGWQRDGLALTVEGRVLALALDAERMALRRADGDGLPDVQAAGAPR